MKKYFTTRELARTAILTAIVFVSMYVTKIEVVKSVMHIGSLAIVVISLTFSRKEAVFASAIGASIFDLVSGFVIFIPFTFVARGLLSLIVSYVKEKSLVMQLIAAFVGGVLTILIYYVANLILYSNKEALIAVLPDVVQLGLGIVGVYVAKLFKDKKINS